MSRKSKIRWRESDRKELQRTINNYNAKLRRLEKSKPELAEFLPKRITKKEAMGAIESRADFTRLTRSLQRFTQRGAEAPVTSSRGAKATKWEVDEFNRAQRAVNIRKAKERAKLEAQEVKIAGKGQGSTRAQMGTVKHNELKPSKQKFSSKSQKEWELAKRAMDERLRSNYDYKSKRYMLANYVRGLRRAGYSEELAKHILTIDPDKFAEIVGTDETATFDFIYDPLEMKVKEDKLWETWEEHGSGKNAAGFTLEELEEFDYHIENALTDEESKLSFRELFHRKFTT